MGTHEELFKRLIPAIRGQKIKALGISGGSVNYRLMDDGTALMSDWSNHNRDVFLGHLANMKKTGHMSLRGPNGVACEQGSPGAHWYFNIAPLLGVYKFASLPTIKGGHLDNLVANITKSVIMDEVGLCRNYRWKKYVLFPSPRVKDSKKKEGKVLEQYQTPNDGYRNVFLSLALGEAVSKPPDYWKQDQAIAVSTMRELIDLGLWSREDQAAARLAPMPKLYLPIIKTELAGGGYIASIEKTPNAITAMGNDCVHWVRCSNEGCSFRYDWNDKDIPLQLKG